MKTACLKQIILISIVQNYNKIVLLELNYICQNNKNLRRVKYENVRKKELKQIINQLKCIFEIYFSTLSSN